MTVTCLTTAEALAEWLIAARKTSKPFHVSFEPTGEPLPEDEEELRDFFLQRMAPDSFVEIISGTSGRWSVTISSWGKDQDERLVVIDLPGILWALENLIKHSHGHAVNGWE